jgi:hypothetical protein
MIKGLSELRRLPRAGKIRLGVMVQGADGNSYPRATDYFVCPDEVKAVFGEKPKELRVVFPLDTQSKVFPQDLKMYRKGGGLFCSGDGETAKRWSPEGQLVDRPCPCEYLEGDKPQCKPTATLHFLLPDVPVLGVWQMTVHGRSVIIGLNSALEHFHAVFGGLRGIPFVLKMVATDTQRYDAKKRDMVRTTIQVPTLTAYMSYNEVLRTRQALGAKVDQFMLPAADVDAEDIIEAEEETVQQAGGGSAVRSGTGDASPVVGPSLHKLPDPNVIDAGVIGAAPVTVPAWTIEACFQAAKSNGVTPTEYDKYLVAVYGTADLKSDQIEAQAEAWEQAEAGGKMARDLLVQGIRLRAKK